MQNTLKNQTPNETYASIELLLHNITHKFSAQYQLPYNDLLSYVHSIYPTIVERYNPTKGTKFSTWVAFATRMSLITHTKKELRHMGYEEINEEICGSECQSTFLIDLLEDISDDARYIVNIILNEKRSLSRMMQRKNVKQSKRYLKVLTMYLRDRMGWSSARIEDAISCITKSLQYEEN